MKSKYRILFAAGGTGGHLFPAIAVADQIKLIFPEADILFVGTKKKLESEVVPNAGYKFESIWISGFARKLSVKIFITILQIFISVIQSLIICFRYKPLLAVGTGAYVCGPILWAASVYGSKIMLLEQNNFPGLTNRLLENKADEIHVSFESSKKFFKQKEKIFVTGNPIRTSNQLIDKKTAVEKFGLNAELKTILILGGSLGARNINHAVLKNLDRLLALKIQIIWQTGKNYYNEYQSYETSNLKIFPFLVDMLSAYSAADLVIARAGATTIAEVSALGLPVIFIPSDNVTDDHQYKNAKALFDEKSCELLRDNDAANLIYAKVVDLLSDENKRKLFSENIKKFSKPDAASIIAKRAVNLIKEKV